MDNRFALAVDALRARLAHLSDAAIFGAIGSRICTQVANDYDVDNDELYIFVISE